MADLFIISGVSKIPERLLGETDLKPEEIFLWHRIVWLNRHNQKYYIKSNLKWLLRAANWIGMSFSQNQKHS